MNGVPVETLTRLRNDFTRSAIVDVRTMLASIATLPTIMTIKGLKRNPDQFVKQFSDMTPDHLGWRTFVKANTYLIAKDEGLDAAMLYKLSNGANDPRGMRDKSRATGYL